MDIKVVGVTKEDTYYTAKTKTEYHSKESFLEQPQSIKQKLWNR